MFHHTDPKKEKETSWNDGPFDLAKSLPEQKRYQLNRWYRENFQCIAVLANVFRQGIAATNGWGT
ncbi:hypothetical protein RMSM_05598 [Rhodopirellula maiorica SM1]|uniref:Uncharacterized protein n=1 Tax=Rhodopirellula maiorica SM1 TaxID=1265738 RepID=M5RQ05_9BACT|nr:hypothetical protein RMSM_05598 [Rhodopirellula maiorica SM1]